MLIVDENELDMMNNSKLENMNLFSILLRTKNMKNEVLIDINVIAHTFLKFETMSIAPFVF